MGFHDERAGLWREELFLSVFYAGPQVIEVEGAAEFSMVALDALAGAHGPHFYEGLAAFRIQQPFGDMFAGGPMTAFAADVYQFLVLLCPQIAAGFAEPGDMAGNAGGIFVGFPLNKAIEGVSVLALRP